MVAARKGDDAARPLIVGEVAQPMPRTADLERADRLQALGLAPDRYPVDDER